MNKVLINLITHNYVSPKCTYPAPSKDDGTLYQRKILYINKMPKSWFLANCIKYSIVLVDKVVLSSSVRFVFWTSYLCISQRSWLQTWQYNPHSLSALAAIVEKWSWYHYMWNWNLQLYNLVCYNLHQIYYHKAV